MDVIITHVNADFDAFASMVAAKKLYPDAVMVFPGSQEKNLRDFFMESTLYILSLERAKDIDLDKVDRLIMVDTRQKPRIGRFADLEKSDKVEIHIYDHHPDSDDDVKGDTETIRQVGATTTILVELIREKGIALNAEEATILALGIYEDTGSFTFSSTTHNDLEAASWLLKRGANLNLISNMMTNELSRDQIEVLYELIEESEVVNFGGVDVTITTAGAEGYVGDLAILVHKFRDMENLDAIFAIVRMEDRIHLIARSSLEEVNAGEIASEFGGGGHPTAASATIKDLSLYQAKDKLISLLHERVRPKRSAGEIMSRPVITIGPDQTILEASQYLSRYQISSLPVVRDGGVIGILHRNAVEKALHHGLEIQQVHEYMNPGVMFVTPEEPIERVLGMTVESRLRLVPVIEDGKLVGVISRSDLLEHLKIPRTADSAGPDEYPVSRTRSKSIRKLMEERLPLRVLNLLRRAGDIALARGEDIYLVGGAVRDLLLRNHNLDIDLVVEGDGIGFAKEFCTSLSGTRMRSHAKFGTAVVLFEDGFKIDIASARHEYYARPGALPTVEMSSIKRDLYRRDFTINTLAVSIKPTNFGQVIDFFGGARDIKERSIRVLHNFAFVEDPTRILRAIRFCSRFGFQLGKHTLSLMKAAIKMKIFDKVEGKRLLNEFIYILNERNPLTSLTIMAAHGIPQAIHPALGITEKTKESVEAVSGVLSWWKYQAFKETIRPWLVYFQALTDSVSDDEFKSVLERFSVSQTVIQSFSIYRSEINNSLAFVAREHKRPSEISLFLKKMPIETLLFMMAKTPREQSRMIISEYLNKWRFIRPSLTGKDLIQSGYVPGPIFNDILRAITNAKLDGEIFGAEQEIEYTRKHFPISLN